MPHWNTYRLPQTLEDAVKSLSQAAGPALVVGGGTDLLLDIQQGRHAPVDTLVDVTRIPELTAVELRQDFLYIGAAAPISRVVASPLVARHAQALKEAGSLIAGPQVRNTATLGGNVAHALPAADGTIALTALAAEVEIAGTEGCRRIPLSALFLGPGKSALKAGSEILVAFYLPLTSPHGLRTASAFRRVMRPQGVALPVLNCAVWVARYGDTVASVRIAAGPGGPVPFRARQAEEALYGRPMEPGACSDAVQALLAEAHFRTSPHRATADYRRHLAASLFEDTLLAAWERAA